MRMTADTVVAGSTVPKAIGPSLSSIGASIWLRCYRLSKSSGPTTIAPAVNRASFPKIRNSTSWTVPSVRVRRMMGRVGAKEAFDEGRRNMEELAGVVVKTKAVERGSEAIGQDVERFSEAEPPAAVSGN